MVAGLASVAAPKGLATEARCLPRDVATHIAASGFTTPYHMHFSFTLYPYHTIWCEWDVLSRLWRAWTASSK